MEEVTEGELKLPPDQSDLYVTRNQLEAVTLADKFVVMRSGHLEQIGRPIATHTRPETLCVAGVIGSLSIDILPTHATSAPAPRVWSAGPGAR